jgi:uncharacterized RDD family membrane protein YckC
VSVPPPGWVEPTRAAVAAAPAPSPSPSSSTQALRAENRRPLDSRRAIARLIDWILVGVVAQVISSGWGDELGSFVLFQCLLLIYNHLFEVTTGATLGKRLVGLRVASLDDGGLPSPRQAATRGVIGIVEIGVIAAISIVVNKQRRRLGDYAAGTAVVDARKHPVTSRALFAGAIAYPVVWLVPTLLVCSMAAKGTLPGSYRSQVNDLCEQARAEAVAGAYGGDARYVAAVLVERDRRIAALAVPRSWRDRHEQLLASLSRQTNAVVTETSGTGAVSGAVESALAGPSRAVAGYNAC